MFWYHDREHQGLPEATRRYKRDRDKTRPHNLQEEPTLPTANVRLPVSRTKRQHISVVSPAPSPQTPQFVSVTRGQSFTCQPWILYLLHGGSLSWSSCLLKSSFFRSLIASHPLWPLHRECDGQISGIQNQNEMKRMSRPPKRKGEQCFYRIKQAQMTQHSVEA